jgi:drug/metabolite transporter (DMT)-like permease
MVRNLTQRVTGYGLLLAAALCYGTFGVWSRLMGPSFAPFYQSWVRGIIILLVLTPLILATKAFRRIDRRDWGGLSVYIGFTIFTQVPLYYAFNNAPIGTVQLVFYSLFVLSAYAYGRLFLGELITGVKLVAMALAFVGLAIVFGVSVLAFAPLGLVLAAANGVASGGEMSATKHISHAYSPAYLAFLSWAAVIVTHLPLSLALGEPQPIPQLSWVWLWLVIFAVVNALAFWLGIWGFKYVDASIGSLLGLTEVVFSVAFGAVIFGERQSWLVLVGGLCIMVAAMLPDVVALVQRRRSGPVTPLGREL